MRQRAFEALFAQAIATSSASEKHLLEPRYARRLISDFLPKTFNNVSNLATSTSVSQGIDIGIQGAWEPPFGKPSIYASINYNHTWGWSQTASINIEDWQSLPSFDGSSMTYEFYATGGTPNTRDNIFKYMRQDGQGVLSQNDFNLLQTSAQQTRNETTWAVKDPFIVPARRVLLGNTLTLDYGEVMTRINPETGSYHGLYSDLHRELVYTPISLDFSNPMLRPPQRADWNILVQIMPADGQFFPATGTVTLNSVASTDTEIRLAAELTDSNPPAPSVDSGNAGVRGDTCGSDQCQLSAALAAHRRAIHDQLVGRPVPW